MESQIPIISIIIPAYNAAEYLPHCLESLLSQTYPNLEIIIVNDASTDHTLSVIKRYANQDNRIRFIDKQVNGGVSLARNDALHIASGTYLMFVDGDDWLEPHTCEVAIQSCQENKADIVMWSYIREMIGGSHPTILFDSDRAFISGDVRNLLYRRMVGPYGPYLAQPERADSLSTVWGKLYRRDMISQNDIWFEDIRKIGTGEDLLFNLEVFYRAEKVIFLNQYLYHYRRNLDSSITTAYKPDLPQKWKIMFQIIRQHLRDCHAEKDLYESLNNRIVVGLIQLGINEMECKDGVKVVHENIRSLINDPVFREALSSFDLSELPPHWKLFFIFAKKQWTAGVYVLLLIIQKLRGR